MVARLIMTTRARAGYPAVIKMHWRPGNSAMADFTLDGCLNMAFWQGFMTALAASLNHGVIHHHFGPGKRVMAVIAGIAGSDMLSRFAGRHTSIMATRTGLRCTFKNTSQVTGITSNTRMCTA